MNAVTAAVLGLFSVSVIGLVVVMLLDQPDREDDEEDQRDAAWIAELHRLNQAMPYVRKHRAREALRHKGGT